MNRADVAGFAFMWSLVFCLISLIQVVVGLSVNKSWQPVTVIFAALTVCGTVSTVYFGFALMRELLKRRLAKQHTPPKEKPSTAVSGEGLGAR